MHERQATVGFPARTRTAATLGSGDTDEADVVGQGTNIVTDRPAGGNRVRAGHVVRERDENRLGRECIPVRGNSLRLSATVTSDDGTGDNSLSQVRHPPQCLGSV